MPKSKVTMEVFRAGKQTDASGQEREWTEADLDKIIEHSEAVDGDGNKIHRTPICIGHPEGDTPAQGWIGKFFRKGKSLFAETEYIRPKFMEALKEKMFRTRSIALRGDLSPRHLAFLGGESPAVKGLQDVDFKESNLEMAFSESDKEFSAFDGDDLKIDFNEMTFGFSTIARVFQSLRDKMVEKDGIEKADSVISQYQIDNLKEIREQTETPLFKEKTPLKGDRKMPTIEEVQAELATAKSTITDLNSQFSEVNKKLTAANGKIETMETEREEEAKAKIESEFSEFADQAIKDSKILPRDRENVITMLRVSHGQEAIDFSEGDKTVKKTPYEIYKSMINKSDSGISFGEFAKDGENPQFEKDKKLETEINAYAKENGVKYNEASKALFQSKPELFEGLDTTENK